MRLTFKHIKDIMSNILTFMISILIYSVLLYYGCYITDIFCSYMNLDKPYSDMITIFGYILSFTISTGAIIFSTRNIWCKRIGSGLSIDEVYINMKDIAFSVGCILFILLIFISIILGIRQIINLIPYQYVCISIIALIIFILSITLCIIIKDMGME